MRVSLKGSPRSDSRPVPGASGPFREVELRDAADKAPFMVWVLAPTGRYTFFNEAWLAFTGRNLTQELGWGWLEGVHRSDRGVCLEECQRALRNRSPLVLEHRLRGADGKLRWVLAHGSPLLDARGQLLGYIGSSVDITDLKESSRRTARPLNDPEIAGREREAAARIAAARADERAKLARELHDGLDQTLTAIKLELGRATAVFKRDGLRPQAVDRLQSLIGLADIGIATVKRIATSMREMSLDHRGLLPAVRWEATTFQARTGIRCRVLAGSEPTALTLEQQTFVFRVFQEALTNVTRHAGAGAVSVSLVERHDTFELRVRDNGRGITKAQKSSLRSIGLMGMRERVAQAGGTLEISGHRGKGTTLVVRIELLGPSPNSTKAERHSG